MIKNEECQFCVFGQTLEASTFCILADEMQSFTIAREDLSQFLQENPETFLLDVRTTEEHHHKNLGGKLIPLGELPMRLDELDPLKPTLIYCQSGQRSQRAVLLLRQAGFRTVYHLAKGLDSL